MNLKGLVQEFCRRQGLPVPATVASSSDVQVAQVNGLLNELGEDLTTRKAWQANVLEATFASAAAEDQGSINTICPSGFVGIIKDTMFNRTSRLSISGGMPADDWQADKATAATGPYYKFRLRGNRLIFMPALPAAQAIYFEYFSSWFVRSVAGAAKPYFTADDDTFIFDDSIAISWLRWKWRAEKGLEYAEQFRAYEALVATFGERENSPRSVSLSRDRERREGGIVVPVGNWNL